MRGLALLAALVASVLPLQTQPAATTKAFTITAQQFTFKINPSPFVVNQGDTVTLDLTSIDVQHGFFLEGYGINVVLNPGQHITKTFVASTPGTFTYACTVVCGAGHTDMNGTLIVNAPAASPAVSDFTPKSGPTAGGTVVAITGANFQNGATVAFGNAAAVSTTVNDATSISAIAPAHGAGNVTVTVTNPDGQTVTAGTYTYAAPTGHGKRRAVSHG
jgi:plastocyanin